jgi:secretion/DNA translocation related TadE-like protein
VNGGSEDVWNRRRRLGEVLRRWATPRASRQMPEPGAADAAPYAPTDSAGRRRPLRWRLCLRRSKRDRGAATVFVLAVGLVLVLLGVAGAAVGAARVGRHRAQAAADLGALAGAARAVDGARAACARASRFAAANRGRLTSCEISGLEVVVHAEVAVTPLPGLTRRAAAGARAGPVYATAS